jgi:hypothetical protein
MTNKEKIAYISGIIDGEGYIGIKKTNNRKDCRNPQYHERIQVRMIEESAILFLKDNLGGNYYKETNNSKYSKHPLYCYQASDKTAANIIKKVQPYLIVKKRQAVIILKLRESKDNKESALRGSPAKRPMNPKIVEYRESLYQQIKNIHKGGADNGRS